MAPTSGKTPAREEIRSQTPPSDALQIAQPAGSRCRSRNKCLGKNRCRKGKVLRRKPPRSPAANSWASARPDADADTLTNFVASSALHDSPEARALQTLLGGFRGFLIRVRSHLHTVIFASLRSQNKGGKFIFLQTLGEIQRIRFATHRHDLQCVAARLRRFRCCKNRSYWLGGTVILRRSLWRRRNTHG